MFVSPVGPTNRPLLALVGEAPGVEEERLGKPFVGSSGQLLDRLLQQANIDRSSCYITHVVKKRPPNNDFGTQYLDAKRTKPKPELLAAQSALLAELAQVQPSLVVAVGGEAFRALTAVGNPSMYRGTIHESNGLRILPTLHPAYLLRGQMSEVPVVVADLKKALRQAKNPSKPVTRFIPDPSFAEALHYLNLPHTDVAYDLETTKNRTRLFGFAWSPHDACAIPFMRGHQSRWTEHEETQLWQAIRALLENPRIKKRAQNAQYDGTIMAREAGIAVRNLWQDTMLSHHLLYPEMLKGLDFQSSLYTDHPMYWGEGTNPVYCCYDCVVTFEAGHKQEAELIERGMWDFFQRGPMATLQRIQYLQTRGVLVDTQAQQALRAQEVLNLEAHKAKCAELGYPHNPLSSKKVMEHLYDTLKIPAQYKGFGTGKRRTSDDDALQAISRKFPKHADLCHAILDTRQTNTLISTFIDQPLANGRAITSYNVAGTVTGRLASSANLDGLGGNLQNLPRGSFRCLYRADEGKVIIKADLSQAEYRVLVWKARILRIIDRWVNDPDFNIHRFNASNIYRVSEAQVSKTQYSNTKSAVYGANYNMGHVKVSRMYNIPLRDAKFILDTYHETTPEVRGVFQQEIRDELVATRRLTNPLGRERVFFGMLDDELFRSGYSHYCQSTVGDLINLALVELVDLSVARPDLGLEVLLQVHDELVCQIDKAHVEEGCELMRKAMERPLVFAGVDQPLIIPADVSVGPNWGTTMKLSKWKETQTNAV